MIWVVSVLLLVLWLLGMLTGYTFGGMVHLLLGLALLIAMVGGARSKHRV